MMIVDWMNNVFEIAVVAVKQIVFCDVLSAITCSTSTGFAQIGTLFLSFSLLVIRTLHVALNVNQFFKPFRPCRIGQALGQQAKGQQQRGQRVLRAKGQRKMQTKGCLHGEMMQNSRLLTRWMNCDEYDQE